MNKLCGLVLIAFAVPSLQSSAIQDAEEKEKDLAPRPVLKRLIDLPPLSALEIRQKSDGGWKLPYKGAVRFWTQEEIEREYLSLARMSSADFSLVCDAITAYQATYHPIDNNFPHRTISEGRRQAALPLIDGLEGADSSVLDDNATTLYWLMFEIEDEHDRTPWEVIDGIYKLRVSDFGIGNASRSAAQSTWWPQEEELLKMKRREFADDEWELKIVFAAREEIYLMNSDGTGLTRLTNNAAWDRDPAFSPDGSKIAFSSYRDGGTEIFIMNSDGTGETQLTHDLADSGRNSPVSNSDPAFSPDGSEIAFTSLRRGNWEINVMNADGTNRWYFPGDARFDFRSSYSANPAFSPDGSKIVFDSASAGNEDIFVMNVDGTAVTNLTNHPDPDFRPVYSPDGTKIAFESVRDGDFEIYIMNADGTGVFRLTNHSKRSWAPAFSPDGSQIVFSSNRDGNWEIYVMNADGSEQTRLTDNSCSDAYPSFGLVKKN